MLCFFTFRRATTANSLAVLQFSFVWYFMSFLCLITSIIFCSFSLVLFCWIRLSFLRTWMSLSLCSFAVNWNKSQFEVLCPLSFTVVPMSSVWSPPAQFGGLGWIRGRAAHQLSASCSLDKICQSLSRSWWFALWTLGSFIFPQSTGCLVKSLTAA